MSTLSGRYKMYALWLSPEHSEMKTGRIFGVVGDKNKKYLFMGEEGYTFWLEGRCDSLRKNWVLSENTTKAINQIIASKVLIKDDIDVDKLSKDYKKAGLAVYSWLVPYYRPKEIVEAYRIWPEGHYGYGDYDLSIPKLKIIPEAIKQYIKSNNVIIK